MDLINLISRLNLTPHPEGGYFSETYRAASSFVPDWDDHPRDLSTAIYFLLHRDTFSAFHRIRSDEIWHHYMGSTAEIHILHTDGGYELIVLGKDIEHGEVPQAVVPAGAWFASRVREGGDYFLAGCTVAPGFDFRDFELAERKELIERYPRYKDLIISLTR